MLMMKAVALLLWLGTGSVLASKWRSYTYFSFPSTWDGARQFCRSYGSDLATLVTPSEVSNFYLKQYEAWIGLRLVGSDWQWRNPSRKKRGNSDSSSEETYDIMNIFATEPKNGENCGIAVYSSSKASGRDCNSKYFVFCNAPSNNFFPVAKTWAEGLQYCQNQGGEYMTFPDAESLQFQDSPVYQERDFPVWIGLHHDSGNWSWSDGKNSNFRTWSTGSEPGSSPGSCVAVSSLSHSMSVKTCTELYPFVCYRHSLIVLPELLPWEQGLESCWGLSSSTDHRMLSVDEEELAYLKSLIPETTTTKLWVGLRFMDGFWFWSDGSPVILPSLPPCPEHTLRCGAMDLNSTSIVPVDCNTKLNVLCYKTL